MPRPKPNKAASKPAVKAALKTTPLAAAFKRRARTTKPNTTPVSTPASAVPAAAVKVMTKPNKVKLAGIIKEVGALHTKTVEANAAVAKATQSHKAFLVKEGFIPDGATTAQVVDVLSAVVLPQIAVWEEDVKPKATRTRRPKASVPTAITEELVVPAAVALAASRTKRTRKTATPATEVATKDASRDAQVQP